MKEVEREGKPQKADRRESDAILVYFYVREREFESCDSKKRNATLHEDNPRYGMAGNRKKKERKRDKEGIKKKREMSYTCRNAALP